MSATEAGESRDALRLSRDMRRVRLSSGSVAAVRIAGVRVSPPSVRVLAQILEDAGHVDTGAKLTEAIRLAVVEPPLTLADHEAILTALGDHCPSGLSKLRRELLDDHLKRRRAGL